MSIDFILEIESSDAAFSEDPTAELVDILQGLIARIRRGQEGGTIMDVNGNACGTWELTAEPDEVFEQDEEARE